MKLDHLPKRLLNFIGGQFVEPLTKAYLPNPEPATGLPYCEVAASGEGDVERAIDAAQAAFPAWSALTAEARAGYLRGIARGIRERQKELAAAESLDTGKPVRLAQTLDIPRAAANFEYFADAILTDETTAHITDARAWNITLHAPLGVVACISPWNLPLYLLTWKIAPALATGNTVVAKPSEVTPLTATLFAEICEQARLPHGVLNLVHGTGPKVGDPLVRHPRVKAVSFTGSTATGAAIQAATAGAFKKLSLELGGKNATIVFADCDFERAVETTARSAFQNQGQICLCGSRILVEKSIFDRFKTALVAATRALHQGDPSDAATDQGALVSAAHFEKVLSSIERAKREGGKILTGGSAVTVPGRCAKGWFVAPTLLEGLGPDSATNQEEIFGPVATLQAFETEDAALALANGVRYGLATSVFTSDITRAHRMSARLETGLVWINTWMLRDLRTPFGGMKASGVGREGGREALRFFTETKNVCIGL